MAQPDRPIARCTLRERALRHRLNHSIDGGSLMLNSARKSLSFAAAIVSLATLAGIASAETTWQKQHPRRTQVNHRLANQNRRIHNDVNGGRMTKARAAQVQHEGRQGGQEHRDMASENGGPGTKSEQHDLNSQASGISHGTPAT